MKTTILVAVAAAALLCGNAAADNAVPSAGPTYTASQLVNSADYVAGALAPNTIVALFGSNLSFTTAALATYEIQNATLPTELPSSGVHVYVGNVMASIYYVSPTQINFLIPAEIPATTTTFQVVRDGFAGPLLPVTLVPVAPAFYMIDTERVVAEHLDGSVVLTSNPARPGEIIVLYATGLGQTIPPLRDGEVPANARPIANLSQLQILLDGTAVAAANILYAGTAPNFCGLYQINLKLPATVGPDPQIQIGLGSQLSPKNVRLVVLPAD